MFDPRSTGSGGRGRASLAPHSFRANDMGRRHPRPETSDRTSYFSTRRLLASDEWIRACVDWCKKHDPSASGQTLLDLVESQWLDTDIRGEGVQSGPQVDLSLLAYDRLKPCRSPPVVGRFSLQILSAYDISKPAYNQMRTLMKADDSNCEVTSERTQQQASSFQQSLLSSRMLKLTLTDGFNSFEAIEHEPCPCLKEPVPPGLKVTLNGGIEVRRGLLLLTPKVIKVLGGKVDEMETEQGLKRKLLSVLRKEADPGLAVSRCNLSVQTYRPSRQTFPVSSAPQREAAWAANSRSSQNPFLDDDEVFNAIQLEDDDDDVFRDIALDAVPAVAAAAAANDFSRSSLPLDGGLRGDDEPLLESTAQRGVKRGQDQDLSLGATKKENHHESVEKSLLPVGKPSMPATRKMPPRPFQYLKGVTDRSPGTSVVIKGTIVTLVGKLRSSSASSREGGWELEAIVTDGTDSLWVAFSPTVLEGWIGVKAQCLKSSQERCRLKEKLKELSQDLVSLNALMCITFHSPLQRPSVTAVTPINPGHAQQLKIRQRIS